MSEENVVEAAWRAFSSVLQSHGLSKRQVENIFGFSCKAVEEVNKEILIELRKETA